MRANPMILAVCCGLASSTYVTAIALGQLASVDISAGLALPTPAFIALLSLGLFGLAAARRRIWNRVVTAPWSASWLLGQEAEPDAVVAKTTRFTTWDAAAPWQTA